MPEISLPTIHPIGYPIKYHIISHGISHGVPDGILETLSHGVYHGMPRDVPMGQSTEHPIGYIDSMGYPSYPPWDGPWRVSIDEMLHGGYTMAHTMGDFP